MRLVDTTREYSLYSSSTAVSFPLPVSWEDQPTHRRIIDFDGPAMSLNTDWHDKEDRFT